MRVAVLALASAVLAATPGHAETDVLKPSNSWNVDFGENKCRLTRFFGTQGNRHLLIIEQYWPSQHFGMLAAGRSFAELEAGQPISLKFYEDQKSIDGKPNRSSIEEYGAAFAYRKVGIDTADQPALGPQPVNTRFPILDTDSAARVEFVSLSAGEVEVRLETGSLRDAFEVLNQCTQDLVGTWGFDLAALSAATRMPHWINEAVMAPKFLDYIPFQRLEPGARGTIQLRVVVSEEGRVADCTIIEAPNIKLLEPPICRAMQRARFQPALDAAGKPMRAFYGTTIWYATD